MTDDFSIVCGTGHRELRDGDHTWLTEQLTAVCAWLRDEAGTRWCVSGLALGFDSDWAEAVLDAGLRLCVAIPFEGQDARWNRKQKARYAQLRAAATREHVVGRVPADLTGKQLGAVVNQRLAQRNLFMLDHSTAVVTDWEPGRLDGGTVQTLREAAQRGMPGLHLNPVDRAWLDLPTLDQLTAYALESTACGHVSLVSTRDLVDARYATLRAARMSGWRVRPARPHEARHDGCADCLEQLAIAALGVLGVPELVRVSG